MAVSAKRVVTLRVFMLDVPWARMFKVFRYGIVSVSKRNDVFVALDTKAPFTNRVSETLRLVTFAVPRTYRFEPGGGLLRMPIDTPF